VRWVSHSERTTVDHSRGRLAANSGGIGLEGFASAVGNTRMDFSRTFRRGALMLLFYLQGQAGPETKTTFTVSTPSCGITVHVNPSEEYSGTVVFHGTNPQLNGKCLSVAGTLSSHDCMQDFVGVIATVDFAVRPNRSRPESCAKLRERVRTIDENETLAKGAPFETTIHVINGMATDIQLFGFEQTAPRDAWRMYRQDLFLDDDPTPFLVLHWRHTSSSIRMIDAIPVGPSRLQQSAER
jgi:hypothetical protein